MIPTDELVKKYDNIYPVKFGKLKMMNADGSFEETTVFDIDYEEANRIRATMTPAELERQRSVL